MSTKRVLKSPGINLLDYCHCRQCKSRNICFLRKIPMEQYPDYVQHFVIHVPPSFFSYHFQSRQWHANYYDIQEYLIEYYDRNNFRLSGNEMNFLTDEKQKERDRERIRELFKELIDMAAKATEEKNPEVSIIFDGIGLVLATDYLKAVEKILSMFNGVRKIESQYNGCDMQFCR